MSKYSGLSQLADAATETISPAFAHYPVRRKLQGAVSLQFETPRGVDRGGETLTHYS